MEGRAASRSAGRALGSSSTGAKGQLKAEAEWPAYGGTAAGQRFSDAGQIKSSNVEKLRVAWTMHTHALDKPSPNSNWRSSFDRHTGALAKNTVLRYCV